MGIKVNGKMIDSETVETLDIIDGEIYVNGCRCDIDGPDNDSVDDLGRRVINIVIDGGVRGPITVDSCDKVEVKGSVCGDITTGGSVDCHDVTGHVEAGESVRCGNVGGYVEARGSVGCCDVAGRVEAGKFVNCDNVGGHVEAKENVICGNVTGCVDAGKAVHCGGVGGNVSSEEGNVVCREDVAGNITAGGSVVCCYRVGGMSLLKGM